VLGNKIQTSNIVFFTISLTCQACSSVIIVGHEKYGFRHLLEYASVCPVFPDAFKKCKMDKHAEEIPGQKVIQAI